MHGRPRALQRWLGAAIAAMTGNEAVDVSSGAAAGTTPAIAACMAGTNPLAASGCRTRADRESLIMHRCERGYKSDVAIANAAARSSTSAT